MQDLQHHLEWTRDLAWENGAAAQRCYKKHYDRTSKERDFREGDQALVPRSICASKTDHPWEDPFSNCRVLGPIMYKVQCGTGPRACKQPHVNLLKQWHGWEDPPATVAWVEEPIAPLSSGALPWASPCASPIAHPLAGPQLVSHQEWQHLKALLEQFPGLFSTIPRWTSQVQHAIPTPPVCWLCTPLCLLPQKHWYQVEQEVENMLHLRVIKRAQPYCPGAQARREYTLLYRLPRGQKAGPV